MKLSTSRTRLLVLGAFLAISAAAGASAGIDPEGTDGCCYPGTKTYLDQRGNAVGFETIGCGADGVVYGTATSRFRWQPGCAI